MRSVFPPDERGSNICKRQARLSRERRQSGLLCLPSFWRSVRAAFTGGCCDESVGVRVWFCSRDPAPLVCVARGGERRGPRSLPTNWRLTLNQQ